MKSKRWDLRTSRKCGPTVLSPERISSRRLRSSGINCASKPKRGRRSSQSSRKPSIQTPKSKPQVKKKILPDNFPETSPSEITSDNRRRRTNTAEYIKRRFLYDTSEPSRTLKRTVSVKQPDIPIPSNAVGINRQKFSISQTTNVKLPSRVCQRSRRGRPLKPKLEYSPPQSPGSDFSPPVSRRERTASWRHRKSSRHTPSTRKTADEHHFPWDMSDSFDREESSPGGLKMSPDHDLEPFPGNKFSTGETYSDILLNELRPQPVEISRNVRLPYEDSRRVSHRRRYFASELLSNTCHTGSFEHRTALSPHVASSEDDGQGNLLDFTTDPSMGRFDRTRRLESMEDTEDEYARSPDSHELLEDPLPINEDVEEEDLLAPELSILAGPTAMTSGDGVLLSGLPDNGTMLTSTTPSFGGSRRKSPVRPMQVLRTKAAHTSVAASPGMQVTVLDGNTNTSPFVYSHATNYDRRLPGTELAHGDDATTIFHPTIVEHSQASENVVGNVSSGLKAVSVLRLATSSATGTTSITIRPVRDRSQRTVDETSPVSQAETGSSLPLSSNSPPVQMQAAVRTVPSSMVSRVFLSNTNRSSNAPSKMVFSASNPNHSSTVRRRPTILKRSIANVTTGNLPSGSSQSVPDADSDPTHISVGRTIGAFTPGAGVCQKPGTQQVPTTSAPPTTGPTKLLQLVTASPVHSQLTASLTASDKLFGRRSLTQNKVPLVTTVTLPSTVTSLIDPTDSVPITTAPVDNPYRYAVLRGSSDSKRYLVLGSHGIFDRSNIAPLVTSTASDSIELIPNVSDDASPFLSSDEVTFNPTESESHTEPEHQFVSELDSQEESEALHPVLTHIQSSFVLTPPVPTAGMTSVAAN